MFCPVCRKEYADDWKVCPTDASVLLRSQYIGKYRIDQVLGVGGMGAVYKAYNPDTQSTVAVKLMHGGASANDAARQRFQREAASVAALRTRHVVSIYDFGSDVDGTLYLVMEYLQGHSLRSEIGPMPNSMPLQRVNFVIEQALRGLGAAHRTGIVHRDLKPENVFVADTDDGEVVKILDFGIARMSRGDTPNLTHSGALMGTPAYMAPEQVAGNRGQVGRHSDVYAIGVILYEMVTGISPFHSDTLSEVLSRILSRSFTPLSQLRPDLPIAVSQLVDRALSDDPAARFGSADALREAWAAAWSQLPAEIRNAPVPQVARNDAARAESAPGIGNATDVPSAPTALPAHLMGALQGMRTPRTGDGFAATAAGPHTPVPSTTPGHGSAKPSGPMATPQPQFQSVTPGPVVVETEVVKKGGKGLWIGLGALLLVGAAVAVFLATQKDDTKADPSAQVTPDAGKATPAPPDAGKQPAAAAPDASVPKVAPDASVAVDPTAGMAYFKGGPLKMGNDKSITKKYPAAEPYEDVTVLPFYIDKTEMKVEGGELPMVDITWKDADAACKKLGKRLPSAAEWEFAARSSALDAKDANLLDKKIGGPAPVGTHKGDCTTDGVCDLLGNVMEWTASGPSKGVKFVRGASFSVGTGGWYGTIKASVPLGVAKADPEIGFRCAMDAE